MTIQAANKNLILKPYNSAFCPQNRAKDSDIRIQQAKTRSLAATWGMIGAAALISEPFLIGSLCGSLCYMTTMVALQILKKANLLTIDENAEYVKLLRDTSPYIIGIIVPIVEECFFRGIIQNCFTSILRSPTAALILSSLSFGAIHLKNPHANAKLQSLITVTTGVIFGLLNQKFGLLASIGAHISINVCCKTGDTWSQD